ncbi:MAG: molybdopterin-dependent oxidoreductase [Rhodanobacter sp.]
MTLDRSALAALPRVDVVAAAHHEPSSRWQGVALEDLLHRSGAPAGEQLRGQAMRSVVRVTASDHYQVVFSLAELDPTLGNEQVILADTQDGHPLGKDGPFRLIVPGDKRPARWIRNVTAIEVVSDSTHTP